MLNLSNKKGFTLIELLVVIAIIGILSSVVLASLSTARAKSRDARRIADIDQLRTALEVYFDSNSSYATSSGVITSWDNTKTSWGANTIGDIASGTTTAIAKIPNPPSGKYYYYSSSTSSYLLAADLERTDNTALRTDADMIVGAFNGIGPTCGGGGGTPQPNGTELCYDITN